MFDDSSGVWMDYVFETPNDVIKFYLPMNEVTSKLTYNQRLIVDTKIDVASGDIPRVWQISKVSRTTPHGIGVYTAAQDVWDTNRDYIEYEVAGDPSTIIGMYADYYGEDTPEDFLDEPDVDPNKHIEMVYTGVSKSIKVGGNSKKLTALFYIGEDQILPDAGVWSYEIDGIDVSNMIIEDFNTLDINQVRIKFKDFDNTSGIKYVGTDYVGKILTVKYTSGNIVGELTLAISGL